MSGYLLWQGPSALDGAPIVVIATDNSANRKTGDMLQTWILRRNVNPVTALRTGSDASVCGQCPRRPVLGGDCYVNVGQAPQSIWRAFRRGRYAAADPAAVGRGRAVRIGSYGDPAAAPASVWQALISGATMHTGYTHQWRTAPLEFSKFCMASADSAEEHFAATVTGYRVFRVRSADDARFSGEAICPASAEGGAKLQCIACGACDGTARGRRGSIVIAAH